MFWCLLDSCLLFFVASWCLAYVCVFLILGVREAAETPGKNAQNGMEWKWKMVPSGFVNFLQSWFDSYMLKQSIEVCFGLFCTREAYEFIPSKIPHICKHNRNCLQQSPTCGLIFKAYKTKEQWKISLMDPRGYFVECPL